MNFTGPDLCALQAFEVIALLKRKEVSQAEVLQAALTRVAGTDNAVNAIPTLCAERAAAQHPIDVETPLAGLPITIKDLTPVAGVRTTYGTRGLADFVPGKSDPLVTRLERKGGVVIGKTNTPEFGAGGNTFNDVFGATLNPWNTTLNAGGSSGGAAVALATGQAWLSHGSDHGGSLRTPAAYCGIVGLRPSPGRASGGADGAGFLQEGVQGPMARSVRDCALFLDAMAEFDATSPLSYPAPETSFESAVIQADTLPRIAFSMDLNGFAQVDADMADHIQGAMAKLERTGAVIEGHCPALPNLEATYHTLRGIMWAAAARRMPGKVSKHFKATLAENTAFGQALNMGQIANAQLDRTVIYNNMLKLFRDFDALACPVVGCMPHPQSVEWVPRVGEKDLPGYMDWLRFAFLATTTGLPAISVPVGFSATGIPVGLQLIGKPRGEAALLAAAGMVEKVMGGPIHPIDPITP